MSTSSSADPPPGLITRRTLLAGALAATGMLSHGPSSSQAIQPPLWVDNVTGLYRVEVARIDKPRDAVDVAASLARWPGRVSVGGGRYSMGGQTAVTGGLQLDMRDADRLLRLDPDRLRVRVQAGMRWRDLQDRLDPLGLAVHTMQSYANFTVGGSVSVNAHGRYVNHGPVGNSVQALQLVLADGRVVEADRVRDAALFRAAIGGYGAVGVITEVELALGRNVRIEREVLAVSLDHYVEHVRARVLADPAAVMHNADLSAPGFDLPVAVTWRRVPDDRPLTEPARLVPRGARYALEQNTIWALTELPGAARLRRSLVEPLMLERPSVKWLNHEASLDVAQLEPRTRRWSTYVLQEYFVPARHFLAFAQGMARVLRARQVEALNVSIRHSPRDEVALLPWAREEVFCFVLYFKQRVDDAATRRVAAWTRELVDLALASEGRYYLPYQLHATQAQFDAAYPEADELRRLKREVDPEGRFTNELWRRYL